jgi:hypothetical protein
MPCTPHPLHNCTMPGFHPPLLHSLRLLLPPLCAQLWTSSPHSLSSRPAGTHTHLHPLLCMVSSCAASKPRWTFEDNVAGQTEVNSKWVFTPVREITWLLRKPHPKFSCCSRRVQTCCSGLPAWLPIKEIPEKPGHQLAASDVHRHTPRENNLNYTIWTLKFLKSLDIS